MIEYHKGANLLCNKLNDTIFCNKPKINIWNQKKRTMNK